MKIFPRPVRLNDQVTLPLAVLFAHMPWHEIEASLAGVIARKVKACNVKKSKTAICAAPGFAEASTFEKMEP